ncbi:MAG: haloacid dehalogenase-like hydrolase [Bacteroidales bacterium]|nr:haloacid dehalogenase-like hydrolase [Bacteroidales bacterium]
MKKAFFLALCLSLALSCQRDRQAVVLAEGKWDANVRQALNTLLATQGKGSYAVFDFDQTSIVHDISQALWVYQVEHLRYADAPAHHFLDGIPTPESDMPGTSISYAAMGKVLAGEYQRLKARLDAGESLAYIHSSDDYLDFRARMVSLMDAMDEQFGSWVTYLWQPALLAGYTNAEAEALIRDAVAEHLGKEKLAVEQWNSPEDAWGGRVARGIWVSPEMKDLYRCLEAAGIDAYVCSASLECIVEVLACDPERGFGLPAERVFGLRFVPGEKIVPEFDPQYKQPNKEGKIDCINAYMAPSYGNAGPVLVAGDSNGDVPMLTEYPGMKQGLLIDVGRSPESAIGQLVTIAKKEGNKGIYLSQLSFER